MVACQLWLIYHNGWVKKGYLLHTSEFAIIIYLDVSYLSIHRYQPFTEIAYLHYNSSYADIYIIQWLKYLVNLFNQCLYIIISSPWCENKSSTCEQQILCGNGKTIILYNNGICLYCPMIKLDFVGGKYFMSALKCDNLQCITLNPNWCLFVPSKNW